MCICCVHGWRLINNIHWNNFYLLPFEGVFSHVNYLVLILSIILATTVNNTWGLDLGFHLYSILCSCYVSSSSYNNASFQIFEMTWNQNWQTTLCVLCVHRSYLSSSVLRRRTACWEQWLGPVLTRCPLSERSGTNSSLSWRVTSSWSKNRWHKLTKTHITSFLLTKLLLVFIYVKSLVFFFSNVSLATCYRWLCSLPRWM